jgi:hypothetical protein
MQTKIVDGVILSQNGELEKVFVRTRIYLLSNVGRLQKCR